jgi:hypothetical protein
MKRFIAPLLLLVSAIALPAQAVEWTQLTENSVGDKFFIDTRFPSGTTANLSNPIMPS